jgi:predicted GH43/DUF377 family glycosyl hydrolase
MSEFAFLNRPVLHLRPDPTRVVVRPFRMAAEPRDLTALDGSRIQRIVARILSLSAQDAAQALHDVFDNFDGRHRNLVLTCERRAADLHDALASHGPLSITQKRLIGAYFLHEFSFEAAALFNPSIVAHPDQTGAPAGGLRFILSLRAVGEGHLSTLTFRSGMIDADGAIVIDATARLATAATLVSRESAPGGELATVMFQDVADISERVIFPITEQQANGIEDARFVKMAGEGPAHYCATFTAFSGRAIRSEMIETRDFVTFQMRPLTGAAAANKGMALFPQTFDGRYAMIARQDNENLHLLYSRDLYDWSGENPILRPTFPWEYVQIGACGAPIELDEGWLLFTHGVGAVRRYTIGAVLLDKRDPSRVIGRLREPLVRPEPSEREGYVPNVVYSCGGLRHGDLIILPYAVSDSYGCIATINTARLLQAMALP